MLGLMVWMMVVVLVIGETAIIQMVNIRVLISDDYLPNFVANFTWRCTNQLIVNSVFAKNMQTLQHSFKHVRVPLSEINHDSLVWC